VHHAQNEIYIDKNYGGILVLWDRLFGSFQEELDEEPVVFGVRKPLRSWNPLWANFQVYSDLWFDAVRTRRWRDRIGIWIRRTGWRPEDVERHYPTKQADLTAFEKFDPPMTSRLRRYVIAHLVLSAIGVLGIGLLFSAEGASAVMIPCFALWVTLLSLGFLSEMKRFAFRFELARLLIVMPASVAAMAYAGVLTEAQFTGVAGGMLMVSTIALIALLHAMRSGRFTSLINNEL
jgi:hypothetical protein